MLPESDLELEELLREANFYQVCVITDRKPEDCVKPLKRAPLFEHALDEKMCWNDVWGT